MFTMYMVRHGTTVANEKKLLQGQIDTPLTDKGIEDAEVLAKKLKGLRFDAIYGSDLGRSFMTEFIIARLDHEEELINMTKELREQDYGEWQDKPKEELLKKHPQYRTEITTPLGGGESFMDVQNRVVRFILSLEEKHPDETILLVSHSGCIRSLLRYFHHDNNILTQPIPHHTVYKLVVDGQRFNSCEEF